MESEEVPDNNGGGNHADVTHGGLEDALDLFVRHAEKEQKKRTYKTRQAAKKLQHEINFAAVLVLAVYTGFTILLWREQGAANKTSYNSYVIGNRPWIKVAIRPTDVTFFQDGKDEVLDTGPFMELTNIGHSPAFDVGGVVDIYVPDSSNTIYTGDTDSSDVAKRQKTDCSDNFQRKDAAFQIMFPGESDQLPNGLQYKFIGGANRANTPSAPWNFDVFQFYVFGCVSYSFGSPAQHFQTVFAYNAWELSPLQGFSGPTEGEGEFTLGDAVPAKRVAFDPIQGENYAN